MYIYSIKLLDDSDTQNLGAFDFRDSRSFLGEGDPRCRLCSTHHFVTLLRREIQRCRLWRPTRARHRSLLALIAWLGLGQLLELLRVIVLAIRLVWKLLERKLVRGGS